MILHMELGKDGYDIVIERSSLCRAGEILGIKGKAIVVTDSGVPAKYAKAVSDSLGGAKIVTLPEGEATKSLQYFGRLLEEMLAEGLTRTDAAVAVGGGVVGDLTGFAAACYMRGIDFYNIPTTLLSEIDSSIGGKTAIDLNNAKNIVGAFHQPKKVLIDPDTLKTLPKRQISAGLAEAVKMALTSDRDLFEYIEACDVSADAYEKLIYRSLLIKKAVVEADEKELGLRRILNFGHTFGHGIEAAMEGELFHGECVALGMIPMLAPEIRGRVIKVLEKLGLPTKATVDTELALGLISSDKKCDGRDINTVFVDEIGSFRMEKMPTDKYIQYLKTQLGDII